MTHQLIIDSPVRIFHHKEHGSRLIFTQGSINPRNLLGKFGVDFHNDAAALSRSVVKVRVRVLLEKGESANRDMNINRSSLMKYISATRQQQIDPSITDEKLVELLNATLDDKTFKPALRHAGQHHQRLLDSYTFIDNLRGRFFSWLYQKTIETLSALRKRFFFASSEKSYFNISEILAKFRFKKAVEEVPAYQKFISNDQQFTHKEVKSFGDIPVTTKDNYIKANSQHDRHLHRHGMYPVGKKKIDTSTGTTGKPTSWVRSAKEVRTVKKSLKVAAQIEYGERPLHYINAFALGPWATGMTAYEMMRATGSVFASSPDVAKILDNLEDMYREENGQIDDDINLFISQCAPHFDGNEEALNKLIRDILEEKFKNSDYDINARLSELESAGVDFIQGQRRKLSALILKIDAYRSQILITGYPPFLKDLVDAAKDKGIDFSKYQARGVVGGQAISEAMRDALVGSGFAKINSSYGASDCDINIGMETDFEMQFRKVLETHPDLAEELYGKGRGVPMVFHYDPFNYHIESDDTDELLFTCNRNDRSSPRIRYALGDKGRVYAASDIEAILAKYGINDLKPKVNFPLLFVWGRDSSVTYRGAKVAFTDLERALTNIDIGNQCVKRAFYSYQDESGAEQFDIWVELKEGEVIPSEAERQHALAKLLLEIAKLNQDFAYHLDLKDNVQLPKLRYYTKTSHSKSPIGESNGHHKQVLVITDKNLPADYHQPTSPEEMVDTAISKDKLYDFASMSVVASDPDKVNASFGSGSPLLLRQLPTHRPSQVLQLDDYTGQAHSPRKK